MPNYQSSRRLPGTVPRLQNWALGAVALVSFLLLVQNFGLNILPSRVVEIAPDRIYPLPPEPSHAYFFPYAASEASEWLNPWSRVVVSENGQAYSGGMQGIESIRNVGGGRWTHEQGRIVFSTTDNSDPRQNGRRYSLVSPLLYRRQIADFALCAFIGATMGLYRINRRPVAPFIPPTTPSARWRWHLAGASALFILGLYCNTGTLSPYAVTSWPKVDTATGYLYNTDHPHFRVLFDFVDGESRSVWDHALFLRRILFPVLGWPLMKLWGFEVGGTIAAVMLNVSGLVAALVLLRRRIGEKGAIFAAWILAIYPGAAYWGGLPYPYALIFPASLLLMCGLLRLPEVKGGRLAFISLAMGLAYLGYDLSVFFLPASLGLLAWHRRWRSAFYSAILQMAPMALWVFALHFIFHQPLGNANTLAYSLTFPAYTHMPSMRDWWPILREAPDVFMEIFFGANFIFVPMLFIGVLALNSVTSRIRIWHAEVALLLSAVLLFSFLNLAPPYHAGWMMRGTWIARLYQPMFPALVFFAARWWQNLPPITWIEKILIGCLLAAVVFGNVLVEFGPILDNPLKVSEAAFYRFYDHSDFHDVYEHNLAFFGRRPLGFIKPQPREPTADEILAGIRKQIASINQAIAANRLVLAENRKAYAADARSLAATRAALKSLGHEIKPAKGEIDPIEDQSSTLSEQDNLPPIPATGGLADVEDELGTANAELAAVEKRVLQAQLDLTLIRAELADAEAEYSRAQSEHSH